MYISSQRLVVYFMIPAIAFNTTLILNMLQNVHNFISVLYNLS